MEVSKEGDKIIQRASTQEIFHCLAVAPNYSKILIEHKPDSSYSEFLRWLIEKRFFKPGDERITMKSVAAEFNSDAGRVSKWVRQIYDEIFDFNYHYPEPFQGSGIKVTLSFTNYDNVATFHTSLPVLPRENEEFEAQFFNAKLGTYNFWVDRVDHGFENDKLETTVHLKGGFVNHYREFLLDRAIFEEHISLHDFFTKYDFELDRQLKKLYRH